MLTLEKIKAKKNKEKITVLTAYSYAVAKVLEQAGLDIILVGDSLAMVFQGKENTLAVTVEEMIYHCQAVRRGAPNTFIVADMPFMSYQVSSEQALINAGKILKEANVNAVKLEGAGSQVLDSVQKLVEAGIPVMGHLGFTPQGINMLSGYKIQGKTEESALRIIEEAKLLEKAGVFSVVLEMVPAELAKKITNSISIPTISCGAGKYCDGQVLVIDDVLGIYQNSPSFAKQYAKQAQDSLKAVSEYIKEVKSETFPDAGHSF